MERITTSLRLDSSLPSAVAIAYPGHDLSAIANAALQEALLRRVLPLEQYGRVTEGGRSKSFNALMAEIRDKECYIQWAGDRPTRMVNVAEVHVTAHDGRQLRELKQVFADGTVRERGHGWCAEKMKVGEAPLSAAVRCLAEELGLKVGRRRLYPRDEQEVAKDSGSYPGLPSRYTIHSFGLVLKPREWREQYIEEQQDKKTYFGWA